MLTSCYHDKTQEHGAMIPDSVSQKDSISFLSTHHYCQNFNFVVKADSIVLLCQQPEEAISGMLTDSVTVYRHNHLVVADIRVIPQDSLYEVDSVWVQVARDQDTFGWIYETELLKKVVPNDPISEFIAIFSDVNFLIFLIVISVIAIAYLLYTMFKRRAKIVHFNDINSFYPTLLVLIVSLTAIVYSTIQHFFPNMWLNFYFHPTLNPFIVPPLLAIFLILVWAIIIFFIAAVDVVRSALPSWDALLYVLGLIGVSAIDYIVFSITTLYYIGYVLFIIYCVFSIVIYLKYYKGDSYICGNCGMRFYQKGICPHCGVENK